MLVLEIATAAITKIHMVLVCLNEYEILVFILLKKNVVASLRTTCVFV